MVARRHYSDLCSNDKAAIPKSNTTSHVNTPVACLNICLYERIMAFYPEREVVVAKHRKP